jgi:hypothetical protein
MTRLTIALIAVTAVLLSPSAASADWLPIEEVGTIRSSNQQYTMVANDRGDAVAMWGDDRGVRVSVSRRGGAFGKQRMVPGSKGGYDARAILNEDGRAIVHWRKFVARARQRIEVVGLKVDGGFGKPRAVTPSAEYITFRAGIGPGGRFVIVYTITPELRPIYVQVAPPSGRLGRRITLASGTIRVHDLWYLGTRPMIAWTQPSDSYSKLREREIGRGVRFVATLPKNSTVRMDTASNGGQVAVWTDGSTDGPKQPLLAATRRPGANFGKPQLLDTRVPPQEIDLAIAPSGAAFVAWREWNESTTEDGPAPTPEFTPGRIVTSYRSPGGRFGALGGFRPDEEPVRVEGLGVDIASGGQALLAFSAVRFSQARFYVADQNQSDEPKVTPMTEASEGGYGLAEIDERARAAVSFVVFVRNEVRARRGSFAR